MKFNRILYLISLIPLNISAQTIDVAVTDDGEISGLYKLTISGIGLPEKPNIIHFDSFHNYTVGDTPTPKTDIYQKWTGYGGAGRPKVASYTSNKILSGQSTRYVGKGMSVRDFSFSDNSRIAQMVIDFEDSTQIYFSYNVTVPEGRFFAGASADKQFPSASSWKFSWLMDDPDGFGNSSKFDLCVPTHVGNGNFLIGGNVGNIGYLPDSFKWSWHQTNYFNFGLKADKTNPSSANGYVFLWHTSPERSPTYYLKNDKPAMFSGKTEKFNRLNIPGWWGNGDWSNFDAVYDDIYVAIGDNSFSRIDLVDSLDADNIGVRVTIPFTTWTSEEITAHVPKEFIDRYREVYLVFYNKNNEVLLTSSLLDCPKCPSSAK